MEMVVWLGIRRLNREAKERSDRKRDYFASKVVHSYDCPQSSSCCRSSSSLQLPMISI
jgi:hypothetical protein